MQIRVSELVEVGMTTELNDLFFLAIFDHYS
jgi:hypothetical protein